MLALVREAFMRGEDPILYLHAGLKVFGVERLASAFTARWLHLRSQAYAGTSERRLRALRRLFEDYTSWLAFYMQEHEDQRFCHGLGPAPLRNSVLAMEEAHMAKVTALLRRMELTMIAPLGALLGRL